MTLVSSSPGCVPGAGLTSERRDADFQAEAFKRYLVDCESNPVTATLPASPMNSQIIEFADFAYNFATFPLTIVTGGVYPIEGVHAKLLSTDGARLKIIFHTNRWVVI